MSGTVRRAWLRLLAVFRHGAADADLQEELASHLALAAEEHLRRGVSPEEAHRLAAIALGGMDAARARHRDARGLPSLDSLVQDLRYTVRGFRRDPGFTAIAVIILALGIGANTAVFSVVNPLLLRALPFRDASRLVWIANTGGAGLSGVTFPVGELEEIQRNAGSFEEMGPYFAFFGFGSYKLTGGSHPERVSAVDVGPRFFEVLGVQPSAGRLFTHDELSRNGPKAVLLTDALWQRRFASDPNLVGRGITINDQAFTVVGVLPADFDFASVFAPGVKIDMFLPAVLDEMRGWGNTLSVVGRLKPGVSVQAARAELAELMPRMNRDHREWGDRDVRLVSLKEHISGRLTRSLLVLWGAVGLVILIVCANLSNLLLARTSARSREMALRMALGAGRARVVRQLLTEGTVLALVGAAVGVALAYGLTSALRSSATLSLPLLERVTVDHAALLFTAALAVVTAVGFSVLPALRAAGRNPLDALKEQSRGSTDGRRHAWVRSALVVTEVALACVLLVGAGLLLRSFLELQRIDLGFEPTRAAAVSVEPNSTLNPAQAGAQLEAITRTVIAIPGVEAAGLTDALPLDRNRSWGVRAVGQLDTSWSPDAFVYVVGPGYLKAMAIPIKAGRDVSVDDTAGRPRVVLVNETLAQMLWPGQNAVGRFVHTGDVKRPLQVIGVVGDVRQTSLEEGSSPQMYLAFAQVGGAGTELVIRSTLSPAALASSVRAALGAIDPALVTSAIRPIETLVERAISPRRFLLRLLGGFAGLALLLACLGIYGVVSYAVSQRVQEMAVRMALGATAWGVCREVLASTLRLAAAGVGLGLVASFGVARLIAALLFGTSPTDTATFAGTALLLTSVALVAGAVPALRASSIDPMSALRAE